MFTKHLGLTLVAGVSLLAVVGCGGSGGLSVNVVSLSSAIASREQLLFSAADFATPMSRAVGEYGAATVGASGLESFKLYISGIEICESIETTVGSTAYNNPSGCSTIYENAADNYDTFGLAEAAAATSGKYIDILSQTDRATLTRTASVGARTYNAGLIKWYKPLKIKGTVALGNSNSIRTKACPSSGACTVTADMGTGSAEESIVDMNNGGTWFKFLKPFTVTSGDSVTVDLAFDLEKKVFAGDSVSNGFIQQTSGCSAVGGAGYCGIYSPILRLSPVPRKSTETTQVEIYEMTGPSAEWNLRVEVFYNSADSTKATLAADIYPIPTTATASSLAAGVYVYTVEETARGTTFKAYDGTNSFTFTRGDTGTGTLTCPSGATLAGCTAGATVTTTWTSRTVRTLQN